MKTQNKIWMILLITGFVLIFTNSCKKSNDNVLPTDKDGNVYNTVTIGTQVWMTENLKTTHYRNGDQIPSVTDGAVWGNLTSGAYCDYDNSPGNSETYGRLYNFYSIADSRNLCPTGWHVPSSTEWSTLTAYLGGDGVAGGKLKETGTNHWQGPNFGASNESGLTVLPAGYRSEFGTFDGLGNYTDIWTSTNSGDYAWRLLLFYDNGSVDINQNIPKVYGFSVRCIKDN
jgi:uncharacterized protein (TIGR02145 family)